jgi:DNA-binding NtrC family response regulator
VRQLCEENGIEAKDLSAEFVAALGTHDWPGNVRELKNLLESLVVTVNERVLLPEHLPASFRESGPAATSFSPHVGMTLRAMERLLITETLRSLNGNRTRAAKTLGIGVRTLQRKIKELDIDVAYVPVTMP